MPSVLVQSGGNQGSARLRGPRSLGLKGWFICFSHTCVMMSNSMTSVVIMRGAHEAQKQASERKLLVAPCGRAFGVFKLGEK